jgi:rhodanese-related sulfurtransferase
MKTLLPRALNRYLQQGNRPFLLDVREPQEYDICHIPNSVLIPMQQIPQRLHELNKKQEIVVICHHGMRSAQVGMFLEQNGFENIINLMGGVAAWAEDVDPQMSRY